MEAKQRFLIFCNVFTCNVFNYEVVPPVKSRVKIRSNMI